MDSKRSKKHRSYVEPPKGSNAVAPERPHLQDRAQSASMVPSRRQSHPKSHESSKQSSPSDRDSKGSRREDPTFSSVYPSSRLTESERLKAAQSAKSREDVGILRQ